MKFPPLPPNFGQRDNPNITSANFPLPKKFTLRPSDLPSAKLKEASMRHKIIKHTKAAAPWVLMLPFFLLGLLDAGTRGMHFATETLVQSAVNEHVSDIGDLADNVERRQQVADDLIAEVKRQQEAQNYAATALAIADFETGKAQKFEGENNNLRRDLEAAKQQIKRLESQHEADVAKAAWSHDYIAECERRMAHYKVPLPGKEKDAR